MVAAFGIEPEIGVAVDVTLTGDTPQAKPMAMELGKGPAIKVKDGGMLAHPGVKRWMVATAERLELPYQLEVLLGARRMPIPSRPAATGWLPAAFRWRPAMCTALLRSWTMAMC